MNIYVKMTPKWLVNGILSDLRHYLDFVFALAFLAQAYGFLDFFCGQAWVSTVMRSTGVPTAQFDISLGNPKPGKQDAMDLLTPSGFSFLCKKGISLETLLYGFFYMFEWVNMCL